MKKTFTNLMILCSFLLITGTMMGQSLNSVKMSKKVDVSLTKEQGALFYFSFEDTAHNALGAPNVLLMMMNRFTPDELNMYDGFSLMAVLFLFADFGGENATEGLENVSAYVYEGGELTGSPQTNDPGDKLKEQLFIGMPSFDSLNTIIFDSPIPLNVTKELWIGISAQVSNGYPLVADSETNFDNKGNIAALKQGANWFYGNVNQFMGEGSTFDGDFAIMGIVSNELGIDILSLSGPLTTIYPNPANDRIMLTEVENAKISIFDVTGKMVYQTENSTSTHEISVKDFTQGLYIVRINKAGKVATKKFTIVR